MRVKDISESKKALAKQKHQNLNGKMIGETLQKGIEL